MWNASLDGWISSHRPFFPLLILAWIVLNLWFDFHHPEWLIIDGVVVVVVLIALMKAKFF